MSAMAVVGLTGGIGVGKSTVAAMLSNDGAVVVDVDAVGRDVLEPDGGAFEGVVDAFGTAILDDDGRIDRAALAAAVFGAENRLADLEAISHPAINDRLRDLVAHHAGAGIELVVLDMAVLAESTLGRGPNGPIYDRVVVVEAPLALRLERLGGRGTGEADARARMAAQASDEERRLLADVVIVNDGDLAALRARVDTLAPSIAAWITQARHRR